MLDKFMEWLNDEIKNLEHHTHNNMIWGKYSEAIRIRQMLCDMDALNKTPDREELEDIAEEICDKYCRFPEVYDDKERMAQEKCSKCPLERLLNG